MNVGEILANSLSPNQSVRENATLQLQNAAANNFALYVTILVDELANENSEPYIRAAAGIALKNTLAAKEKGTKLEFTNRWLAMDLNTKKTVKDRVLNTLHTPQPQAALQAAQVIASIAEVELPQQTWPELIPQLLGNMNNPSGNTSLKQATLQAIGFVCEATSPQVLASQANEILTAIVHGARKEEPSQDVRYTALKALMNSLEFIAEIFTRDNERHFLMQIVCETTQSEDVRVQAAAFECLVHIMYIYYEYMKYYMDLALFKITIAGMNNPHENVALQAVEFWSTICELESDFEYDDPEHECQYFAKQAVQQLTPPLLQLLLKQDEDEDEDEWNLSMSAATCLSLLAACVGNDVVPCVVPFIEGNIRNSDWRLREAAVMTFGSIMEGPDQAVLSQLVEKGAPVLIDMLQDPIIPVKDTTAWSLGRICEYSFKSIPNTEFQRLIVSLVNSLQDSPRIASNCCWALMNLGKNLNDEENHDLPTYALSPYFEGICTGLISLCDRRENEANSRTSAYEAMATLIAHSPIDCLGLVSQLALSMLERLGTTIVMQNQIIGQDERNQHFELQSNICNVITSICRRLGPEILPIADQIMATLLNLLQASGKHATTMEDVFLCIGALTSALGANFTRYVENFGPYLFEALRNHEEHQLCSIATGLIGDICRALESAVIPYCSTFMEILHQNFRDPTMHRDVKPPILSCYGDVALAVAGTFEMYLAQVMEDVLQACSFRAPEGDEELADYVVILRENIMDAMVGIVQGLKTEGKAHLLLPYIPQIFDFLKETAMNEYNDDMVIAEAGLLGDLAASFLRGEIREFLKEEWVATAIRQARTNRHATETQRQVCKWAKEMVKRALM